jgi:MOSC domain-containing protein YiiM
MVPVREATVLENLGLRGDVHALPDSSRQILLIEKETLDDLQLLPGQIKENITTTGVNLMSLTMNDRLLLGGEVILQVTKACSPCSRMEELRSGLRTELAGRRGMLARVVKGGVVRVGDAVGIRKAGAA